MTAGIVTRFAPSPTGHLHLGHAHAALFAHRAAREAGGRFILRIEDIDSGRCRPEFEQAIYEDMAWLGLEWEEPVRRQSGHMQDYVAGLALLSHMGLVYPCFCTRAEIAAEIERSPAAPHGPEGPVYPGACRALTADERAERMESGEAHALRIDMAAAVENTGPLTWTDRARGKIAADPLAHGDVVLARKDTPTSYHLSVTVDDHLQGITLVTRGEDLAPATDIHVLLQTLLGFATPEYHHHGLLGDAEGRRFAKRDRAATLRALREEGKSPEEVRRMAGFE